MPEQTPKEVMEKATETAVKVVHDARGAAQAIVTTAERTAQELVKAANTEPTNAELKETFESHAIKDEQFQADQTQVNKHTTKSLESLHKRVGEMHFKVCEIPTKEDTSKIVEEAIRKLLLSKGRQLYSFTLAFSLLIGALVVILGGFKTVLGWIGFSMVK